MFKANKTIETVWNLIGGLIIGMFFTTSIFAANSATFSASCYMPEYVTANDAEQLSTDNQINQEVSMDIQQESAVKEAVYLIQQEKVISQDNNIEIINTISAK